MILLSYPGQFLTLPGARWNVDVYRGFVCCEHKNVNASGLDSLLLGRSGSVEKVVYQETTHSAHVFLNNRSIQA